MSTSSKVMALVQICFDIFGFFMVACMVVVLRIAVYVWAQEPMRLAMVDYNQERGSPERYRVILPQPKQVTTAERSVWMPTVTDSMMPSNIKFWILTSGVSTNASIWAYGKSFQTGGPAAWELVKGAWPLWLVGSVTVVCGFLLRRYRSRVDASVS